MAEGGGKGGDVLLGGVGAPWETITLSTSTPPTNQTSPSAKYLQTMYSAVQLFVSQTQTFLYPEDLCGPSETQTPLAHSLRK